MVLSGERIGILGGTFDPVHNGHVSIAQSFLKSGFIDSLWVLLSKVPPHKEQHSSVTYNRRLNMLNAAFKPYNKMIVSDLESHLPVPSYTSQTLSHLSAKHPGASFFLCLGKDAFLSFTTWHRWQDILQKCELLVAERPDETNHTINPSVLKKTHFVEHSPITVSSTEIREKLANGESVKDLLPKDVLEIIQTKNLYSNA